MGTLIFVDFRRARLGENCSRVSRRLSLSGRASFSDYSEERDMLSGHVRLDDLDGETIGVEEAFRRYPEYRVAILRAAGVDMHAVGE